MFKIGWFVFQPYGLIIALAVLAAGGMVFWEAKRKGQKPEHVLNTLFWGLIGGLAGARAYHVIHEWDFYSKNLLLIFNLWRGGLGIYGALLGGSLAVFVFTKIKDLNFLKWLDIAALGLPLGQAIGRWANFINQELYGYPTDLPWKIYIRPSQRLPEFRSFIYFHPLFFYESIWNLLVFLVVLITITKFEKKIKKGELFCLYLSLYSFGRFWLEFLRPDVWRLFGFPVAQIIAAITILTCLIYVPLGTRRFPTC